MDFDNENNNPFNSDQLEKIMRLIEKSINKQLQDQGFDPGNFEIKNFDIKNMSDLPISEIENMMSDYEKSDIKKIGFAVHIGPDGKPHVRPLNKNNFMKSNKSNALGKSGFIVPFTDIFYNLEKKSYQIISEIQGIKNLENVHLLKNNNDPTSFTLHAETGPFKYKKLIKLKRQVNLSSSIYKLNNGVLEINILVDN